MNESHALGAGAVLADRYELRSELGAGGMGVVFVAHDRELDEERALKVLHADAPADAINRRLARRVTHPNVARTFDLGVAGEHSVTP